MSDTGVWLDTDSGNVVTVEPQHGRLILAAGAPASASAVALHDLFAGVSDDKETATVKVPAKETRKG